MPATNLRKTVLALALAALTAGTGCSPSVDQMIASGDEALGKADYRTAEIQLKSALQKDANNARARWLLGQLSLAVQDGASAEKEIRRAGELGVGNDAIIPALAQALLYQGKVDAVLELEPPADLSPRAKGELIAAQALAHAAKGDAKQANELTAEALRLTPDSAFAITSRARVLMAANKLDEAETLLTGLQQSHPAYGLAWSYAGDLHDLRGDLPKAEQAYSTAIEKKATPYQDRLKRAMVRLRQQNLDGALADAEPLTKGLPSFQPAWYAVGSARFQKKDFPRAQEALERSYQLNNDHVPTLILLGWSNLNLGNLGQASERASRAVAIAPNLVAARLLMATLELRQQPPQPKRAEELVRPVVDAFPDSVPAKSLLIASLQAQGRGAEAAPLLEQIAGASPESVEVQTAIAMELIRAKERDKGLALLEKTVERTPDAAPPNAALVAALLSGKKLDEALVAAERFHAQNPRDTVALRLLGMARLGKGDRHGAEQAFRKVLDVAPADPVSSLYLADLLTAAGDPAGAMKLVQDAYAKHPDNVGLTVVMATHAAADGRFDEAKQLLSKAIELSPEAPLPRLLLAKRLRAEKNPQGALDVLPKEATIEQPGVLAERAEAELELRQYASARDHLERLVKLAPDSALAWFRLAQAYAGLGQQENMEKAIDEAARLAPKDANIGLTKARALANRGKYEEANALVGALELPETEPELIETRLLIAEKKGDRSEHIRFAEALFEARPGTESALGLARAKALAGQGEAAEKTLKDWLAGHPDDIAVALALSRFYGGSARSAEAAALLRPLLPRHPDNVALLNNLAWYLRDTAPAEALIYAERAYAAQKDNAAILDTYATVLARNGKFPEALRSINRAIELVDDAVYLRLQRIEILALSGDNTKAAEELAALETGSIPPALREKLESLGARLNRRAN